MKNNTAKVLVGLIVLLTITSLLGLRKLNYSVPVAPQASQALPGDTFYNLKQLFFDRYVSLIVSSEGRKINPQLSLTDTTLKLHKLDELTQGKSVLIFRYSFKDCDICVREVFKELNKQFTGKQRSRVIVITDSYSDKDFILKSRYTDAKFPIYSVHVAGLGLPAENRNLPFMFIMENDHKVEKMFLPFKELPDQTEEYLSYCKDWLNKNN